MAVGSEGGVCPVCEAWAEDYEPGVSAIKVEGAWYHPRCAEREGLAIAEAEDHHALIGDHDSLLDPDDGPADWHLNEQPALPDDEGPTREKYDAEAELDVAESKRLLEFAMKAMQNAIATLRNEMYDRRVTATIADLSNALAEIDRKVSFV